jgi:hypothetical protein
MKRQERPFIVEVKNKRGLQKSGRSIWGDIDLSAITAETTKDAQILPDGRLVDSDVTVVDAESRYNPRAEQHMADPQEAESVQTGVETPAKPATSEPKKKVARPRKAKPAAKQPAAKTNSRQSVKAAEAPAATTKGTRKIYSRKERAQKLSQIEKAIAAGATIKSAVGQAGISEQTFYQWKKTVTSAPESGGLKDLIALEEENKRLKSLLAERLRKENAELKKKLGLS